MFPEDSKKGPWKFLNKYLECSKMSSQRDLGEVSRNFLNYVQESWKFWDKLPGNSETSFKGTKISFQRGLVGVSKGICLRWRLD